MRNKTRYSILIIILQLTSALLLPAQEKSIIADEISFLFIGDIMGHEEQIWSAENRETKEYDYNDVFKYIKPVIADADIAIANFEVTLGGPPYTGYPQFSSPAALASACQNAGIDYFVTANNHSADRGRKGIISTINRLDSLGIPHTGTFTDSASRAQSYPLIFKKDGINIALLNYTYGTNGIKVPRPVIVNYIDKEVIIKDLKKASDKKPDITIVFLHWGNEYDTIPSSGQATLANQILAAGADLVIGSHPHVLQKMVWQKETSEKKEGIIVYSLGNFVSNQQKLKTSGGAMFRVTMKREENEFRIKDTGYYLTWVYSPIEKYRKKFFILPCSLYENKPEFFSSSSYYSKMKLFINDSRNLLDNQNIDIKEIKTSLTAIH